MPARFVSRPCLCFFVFFLFLAAPTLAQELALYPDGFENEDGPLNPRVPYIAPEAGGAAGQCLNIEAVFPYALAPWLEFPAGGAAEFALRDQPRRTEKCVLRLVAPGGSLELLIRPASEGRKLRLRLTTEAAGKKEVKTADSALVCPTAWTTCRLEWSEKETRLKQGEQLLATLPLPQPLAPESLLVGTWFLDELTVKGEGEFRLDWERGYAAQIVPAEKCAAGAPRRLGVDKLVIGATAAGPDYPVVQVLNGGAQATPVVGKFRLRGEVGGYNREWQAEFAAAGRSGVETELLNPAELKPDIYHLDAAFAWNGGESKMEKHFLYLPRRAEAAGPAKFGLHNFQNRSLGFWPDALPIGIQHMYCYWGYVVGPAWVRDWDGDLGLSPQTPAAEWNWNSHLDQAVKTNNQLYVCLISEPLLPWMRSKDYPDDRMRAWNGSIRRGGAPKYDLYRQFVREVVKRYGERVDLYEVENEPNTSYGFLPEDYALICQSVFEEVHAGDPHARVFGICGTSDFLDFTQQVFAHGGDKYLDGVSWHTYCQPRQPEEIDLGGKLALVNETIAKTGRPLARWNSETGCWSAPRAECDRPLPAEEVAALVKAKVPEFATKTGAWPCNVIDEWQAARYVVTNIVYNFLSGAEAYTFFGWDPHPRRYGPWNRNANEKRPERDFLVFTYDQRGVPTPSLHTLAAANATVQLEGLLPGSGRALSTEEVRGAAFAQAGGGEVAVLWSLQGQQSVLLAVPEGATTQIVDALAQPVAEERLVLGGRTCLLLTVGDLPVYLHCSAPGLALVPGLVSEVQSGQQPDGAYGLSFKLRNPLAGEWRGEIEFQPGRRGGTFAQPRQAFTLAAGAETVLAAAFTPPSGGKYRFVNQGRLTLPGGEQYVFSLPVLVKPSVPVARLPENFKLAPTDQWPAGAAGLEIDRPEQCVLGRSPELAALQEPQFWQGAAELSATVKIGYNQTGLFLGVTVRDRQPLRPTTWPGVMGSCLELFFDFRTPREGLGNWGYKKGVYQILVNPPLETGQAIQTYNTCVKRFNLSADPLAEAEAVGGRLAPDRYWVGYHIPWRLLGKTPAELKMFGFDMGVDGPFPGEAKRKSQLMLFGTNTNHQTAVNFGLGVLAE